MFSPSTRKGSTGPVDEGEPEAVRFTTPEKLLRLVRLTRTSPEPVIGMVSENGDAIIAKSGDGGLAPIVVGS